MTQKSPSEHHRTTLSGYIFATKACIDNRKKTLLNGNTSSTCPHNMVNIDRPTNGWDCFDSLFGAPPAYFNGFRVFASLLRRRRSMEVNQTLHGLWPSPGLLHCVGSSYAPMEFCHVQMHFAAKSCVLLYWHRHCTALQQRASAKVCSVEKRAPPVFGRAAITLGISPHSRYIYFYIPQK